MKLPPAILLGILCFGAGWWVDARWSGGAEGAGKGGHRIPAMAGKTGAVAEAGRAAATAEDALTVSGTGKVKTLDELLRLTKGVPYSTGRARAEIAVRRLTAGELAALGAEMRVRFREPGAAAVFPRQVLNPVLRRWLTLDPLPAVEFAGCAPGLLDEETEEPCYEALKQVALTDFDAATRLVARRTCLDYEKSYYGCIETFTDLPPQAALARLVEFKDRTGYKLRESQGALQAVHGGWMPLKDFSSRWAKSNARDAMTWALALPPTDTRAGILRLMIEALCEGRGDSPEALAILKETPLTVLPAGRFRKTLEELAGDVAGPNP